MTNRKLASARADVVSALQDLAKVEDSGAFVRRVGMLIATLEQHAGGMLAGVAPRAGSRTEEHLYYRTVGDYEVGWQAWSPTV